MKDFHIYAVDTIGHPGKVQKLVYHLIIMLMGNGGKNETFTCLLQNG